MMRRALAPIQRLGSASRLASASSSGSSKMPSQRLGMINRHLATAASSSSEAPVLFEAQHSMRTVVLNRPKALNSLNDEMVKLMRPQLEKWEDSELATLVMLKGNGSSFCAGGDVVNIAKMLSTEDKRSWDRAVDFFRQEYSLDNFIAKMKTPVATVMSGNTLGGGLGLSMHAMFRIATDSTKVAMPETTIGLFPDVGASFFLSRMDGQLGLYLGLTSDRISGVGVFQAGIATHYVPSDRLPALEARLAELGVAQPAVIDSAICEFAADAADLQQSSYDLVGPKRKAIDSIFGRKTAEEIIAGLRELEEGKVNAKKAFAVGGDESSVDVEALQAWARKTRETIEMRSPTSVKLTMLAVREGASLNIDEAFQMDLRIATACCNPDVHPDFRTGVTHLLINKDRKTRADWSPSTLEEVKDSEVRKLFLAGRPPFEQPKLSGLALAPGKPYMSYPYAQYALPSEQTIREMVTGDLKNSGPYALTEDELVRRISRRQGAQDKVGVEHKVREVVRRCCKVGRENTLSWIH